MKPQAYRRFRVSRFVLGPALTIAVLMGVGCHPRPTVMTTSSASVGGMIAGVLNGPSDVGFGDRTITAVNIDTGQRFQTTTGENGGYSIRVPPGTYRLEIQLREGEELAQENATILLTSGDSSVDGRVEVNANRE